MNAWPDKQRLRAFIVLAAAGAASGCASSPHANCRPGEGAAIQETLYFGTGRPNGGVVSADEWTGFLATVVTPRFPQGLTVVQASGQWRGADGSIVQESSRVLQLVHPGDAPGDKSVAELAAAYKSQFQQEAVLRVRNGACVSF